VLRDRKRPRQHGPVLFHLTRVIEDDTFRRRSWVFGDGFRGMWEEKQWGFGRVYWRPYCA
jgi:hypothetical protein